MNEQKHSVEAFDSWNRHMTVSAEDHGSIELIPSQRRALRHHHDADPRYDRDDSANVIEQQKEDEFWQNYREKSEGDEKHHLKKLQKQEKRMKELYANPGISSKTVHGLMIDAGSTGSRLHIFEWEPRVLRTEEDIQAAVSGDKLSFPGTESRWTDRLRPGLSSFASIQDDDELRNAISEYLQPLMDFATSVLHSKKEDFGKYPIFLRATAGMRTLEASDRSRIMNVVRTLFSTPSYNPFYFVNEQARVLSGEEEAIFDWTGVNFLLGELLHDSLGAGTVINPRQTHGALDLGGASTQISFYDPNEDIMSNLFKLQIGQAKHWNVYAHSFLFYGMNQAMERYGARLAAEKSPEDRLMNGIYSPCLPGGSSTSIRTNVHINENGVETWKYSQQYPSGNGFYQATLQNLHDRGDFEHCMELTNQLLHIDRNDWCDFAHMGDCSLDGTYQPKLPSGVEFVGFSNYYHVWQFLKLPERSTIAQLESSTKVVCSMTLSELTDFNNGMLDDDEMLSYCFRSTYVLLLLRSGYGFQDNDTIRVIDVIEGQKVGWALGAMLYEINTMPWTYEQSGTKWQVGQEIPSHVGWLTGLLLATVVGMVASIVLVFVSRERSIRKYYQYETVKDVTESGR